MAEPFRADPDGDGIPERIKWGRLVSTAVGTVLGVTGIKLADLVGAVFAIPIGLYQAVVSAISDFIEALLDLPTIAVDRAVSEATAFVSELGIAGFVAALVVVVAAAYLAARAQGVAG